MGGWKGLLITCWGHRALGAARLNCISKISFHRFYFFCFVICNLQHIWPTFPIHWFIHVSWVPLYAFWTLLYTMFKVLAFGFSGCMHVYFHFGECWISVSGLLDDGLNKWRISCKVLSVCIYKIKCGFLPLNKANGNGNGWSSFFLELTLSLQISKLSSSLRTVTVPYVLFFLSWISKPHEWPV